MKRQSCLDEPTVWVREGPGGLAVPVTPMGSWALKTSSGPRTGQGAGGLAPVPLLDVCSPNKGDGHPQACAGCTQLQQRRGPPGGLTRTALSPWGQRPGALTPNLGSVGFLRPPPQCPTVPHGSPALPNLPPATGADPEAQDQLLPLSPTNAHPRPCHCPHHSGARTVTQATWDTWESQGRGDGEADWGVARWPTLSFFTG